MLEDRSIPFSSLEFNKNRRRVLAFLIEVTNHSSNKTAGVKISCLRFQHWHVSVFIFALFKNLNFSFLPGVRDLQVPIQQSICSLASFTSDI
jgi:hypothetical protein